ncbi:hypothetical protein DKX38_014183 [Salix brachista]|uniref:SCP domain-containing protein n=1 Tax=Salix brachista TaxID=2182728 RepID=A0A5N5LEP3_9ROSI|nr:hypothetical protein DKX38_014183 [Salix brachista]
MWFGKFLFAAYLMASVLVTITSAQNSPQDYVDAHNAVRAEVGVGPIAWNKTVAAYAQKYANSRVESCELEHSGGPYGENIAEGYGNLNGVDAVKMWASEKPFYSHDTNSCVDDECLHYTQVVWRKSVHLGCGRASRYDAVIKEDIPESLQALRLGNYKFAEGGTTDAAFEAKSCEEEFRRCKSPDMNRVVHDVSIVAASTVQTILSC